MKDNRPIVVESILLYSTNTWLAWAISNQYYGGRHWTWCSPFFRPTVPAPFGFPPSALPGDIYDRLFEDVVHGDRHSPWIAKNRMALAKGAQYKQDEGVISAKQKSEIIQIVREAPLSDFMPLLYVIPAAPVRSLLQPVPIRRRAHALSMEYIIPALETSDFDVLSIRIR